jgi:hypothetical protein
MSQSIDPVEKRATQALVDGTHGAIALLDGSTRGMCAAQYA